MLIMDLASNQKGLYVSKAGLKAQGWTDNALLKFLPIHDKETKNPYYSKASPMRLYLISRVKEVENTDAYKLFFEKNRGRVAGARNAVTTKKNLLLNEVLSWEISLKEKPLKSLIQNAIHSYNKFHEELQSERGHEFNAASLSSDKSFLERITVNYIRHNLSHYDNKLEQLFGKVGKNEAYSILNKKIYSKIEEKYPTLSVECKRQLSKKLE